MTVTFNQGPRTAILNLYGSATAGAVSYPYTYAAPQLVIFQCATPPTNADQSLNSGATSTLLCSVPFQATTPAFGAPTGTVPLTITANTMQTQNAYTSGTASYYRTYAATSAAAANSGIGIYTTGQVVMIAVLGTGSPNWAAMGCAGTPAVGSVFVTNGTVGTGTSSTAYLLGVASGSGACVEQGSVGTSGTDLVLNTTSISAGGPVQITSFTRQL
jgi:hypothetical protein